MLVDLLKLAVAKRVGISAKETISSVLVSEYYFFIAPQAKECI